MSADEGSEYFRQLDVAKATAQRLLELAPSLPQELCREAMTRQRHITDIQELSFSIVAGNWSKTDEYQEEGSISPIDWIRHNCRMGAGHAADRVNVGEQLASLPKSTQALADGEIGFAHLSLIARTANAVATSKPDQPFDESLVLEAARESSVGRLWHFCQHVRHAADPEGVAAEQADAARFRRLNLNTYEDGSLGLDGWLDAAAGATVRSALEPLARLGGSEDDRTREQRQADALVELASHGLDAGVLPRRGGQRPHVQITTSLETLRGLSGSPAGEMEVTLPMSAGQSGSFPEAGGALSTCAISSASGPVAIDHRPGQPRTTCCIGPRAGTPTWTIWCCCATATTPWRTRGDGNWSAPMTAGC